VTRARSILCSALFALAVLYAWWFARDGQWVALLVFALPPLACALACLRGGARAAFWAGLLALLWFSHGVMVAWTRAPERGFALAAVALSVAIVFAASVPGLRRRFGARARPS
jgi:uncharacterized membrane protein